MLTLHKLSAGQGLLVRGFPGGLEYAVHVGEIENDRRRFGLVGDRFLWRLGKKALRIWDVVERRAIATVKYELEPGEYPSLKFKAVGGRDGATLYLLANRKGEKTASLQQIDLATARVVREIADLPRCCGDAIAARPDGRLVYPFRPDDPRRSGLALLDPASGSIHVETCDDGVDMPYRFAFRDPSPDGRYWLRTDGKILPSRPGRYDNKDVVLYGVTVQLWEAFSLRFVRRLSVLWLPLSTLAGMDVERSALRIMSEFGSATDRGPLGLPQRGDFPAAVANDDALWNALRLRREALSGFTHWPVWQPDSQAFWVDWRDALRCVGVDGSMSSRLKAQRASADVFIDSGKLTALPGRQAVVEIYAAEEYGDGVGTVVFDGSPSQRPYDVTYLSIYRDQFTPEYDDVALVRALAAEECAVTVDLPDLSAAGVAAAIDALTALVGSAFQDRTHCETVKARFATGEKTYEEDAFFALVAKTRPEAAPALRRLAETFAADQRHRDVYWGDGVAALGHAALALARLDPDAAPTLRRYGALIDGEHEWFYTKEVLPAFFKTHGWTDGAITLGVQEMLYNGGVAFETMSTIWFQWGMGKAVEAATTPEAFAARIAAELATDPYADHTMDEFRSRFRNRSAWVKACLAALPKAAPRPKA